MSQGLPQTDGLQILARGFVDVGRLRVGLMWRNLDAPAADSVAALYVRLGRRIGSTDVELGALYRLRSGANGAPDRQSMEFNAAARRSFGKAAIRLNADFSPEEFGSGPSLYVEGGPMLQLDAATRAAIGVGRRERTGATDYTAFNVGLARTIAGRLVVEARYHATDRAELGPRYRQRIAVVARLTL